MKLKIKGAEFRKPEARKRFAKFLSSTIEGCGNLGFDPYPLNEGDDLHWVVDRANNWRVEFYQDDETSVEIRYRYQCETVKAEQALAAWLVFRVDATAEPTKEN